MPAPCRCEAGTARLSVTAEGGLERGGVTDVAGDVGEPLHQAGTALGGKSWSMALQALGGVVAESRRVPTFPGDSDDGEVVGDEVPARQLGQGAEEVPPGEVAGGAEHDEAASPHSRAATRARFIPLETTPTWLKA